MLPSQYPDVRSTLYLEYYILINKLLCRLTYLFVTLQGNDAFRIRWTRLLQWVPVAIYKRQILSIHPCIQS
uniref:Uncharacterized protein n=1 Tax=Pinctada fucata TaxID=50426 RepID=A0A194AJ58_PINFU